MGNGALFGDVTTPNKVTSNSVGTKVGKSTYTSYLGGLVSMGDGGVAAACKAGNITKIGIVDYKVNNILGLVTTYETIVYGE